jgi:hypothetical protein
MKRLEIGARLKHLAAKVEALRPPCPRPEREIVTYMLGEEPEPVVVPCDVCGVVHQVVVAEIVVKDRAHLRQLQNQYPDYDWKKIAPEMTPDNIVPPAGSPTGADASLTLESEE